MAAATGHAPRPQLAPGERLFVYSAAGATVTPANLNASRRGRPNKVSTTRFTPITWLPKSLFYQFQRVANLYFLFVAIIVCFPWSPKSWKSKVFPFLGVLLWTALKDAYEDLGRSRDDRAENRRKCQRLDPQTGSFQEAEWWQVLAGDLLLIKSDSPFPADLLLLWAAGGKEAFMSTVNLDGETNLKERRAPAVLSRCVQSCGLTAAAGAVEVAKAALSQGLTLQMGRPEPDLAEVRGRLTLAGEQWAAGETNFLPRGCVLRNTDWVLASTVYVGEDTKTRMNASKPTAKVSNMQWYLNMCVRCLLAVLFLVNTYCATLAQVLHTGDDVGWFIMFLKYCVTLYHVVPISLYVVFEMLKLLLGYLVNTDPQMVDPATGQGAVARTADLMEELGQVGFIFSDKTGTLTANEMVFARMTLSGRDLGDFRPGPTEPRGLAEARRILAVPSDPLHEAAVLFFTCLAVCHSVQVEEGSGGPDGKRMAFSGMSPDEVALVQAAADAGIVFRQRIRTCDGSGGSELVLFGPEPTTLRSFVVLHELEFSSDRKRMSVVVRHNEEVWCITKGADSTVVGLLDRPLEASTAEHLQTFSRQGLRTLLLAMKKVDPLFLSSWQSELREAEAVTDRSRSAKVAEVFAKMERGLGLVGVTAVEDRLQDGVPAAIEAVKRAGIRIWVLTGDKTETAVDIARSCAIFTSSTRLAFATDAASAADARELLEKAKAGLSGACDGGLVLDGKTLSFAMESQECRTLVYELGMASRSCVCCRLSPLQKRQIVELVRSMSPSTITLAIGDGANDASMIEGAHVGVGIRGREGSQAVQASDIAISQFRFLVPLLLCHGRRAYRRVAFFLCYYLYKNVALVMSDLIWAHQNRFTGRIAFPEYLSVGFNVFFTSWHILFVVGFDKGVSDAASNAHPELYRAGPQRAFFNRTVFATWMFYALWHGAVAWVVPSLALGADAEYTKGPSEFWVVSCTAFTLVVSIVNIRLLLCCYNPFSVPSVASTLGAFVLFFAYLFALGEIPSLQGIQPNLAGVPTAMFSNSKALAVLLLAPMLALSVDVVEKLTRRTFFPTAMDKVMEKARRMDAKADGTAKATSSVKVQVLGAPATARSKEPPPGCLRGLLP